MARHRWPAWVAAVALAIITAPAAGRAQSRVVPPVVALCAPCHGTDGGSGNVEVPNLAGQHSLYLTAQLRAFRSGQRRHPDMGEAARELSDREIEQLVVYYASLPPP